MRSKQNSPLGLLTHLPFLVFFILTCRCKLLSEFPSDYLFPLNWKISSGIYFSANLLATDFLSFHLQKRSSFTLACGSFIRHGIWGRLFLPFSNLERLCHCLPHTGFLVNPSIFFFFIILTCIQDLFIHFLTFSSLTMICLVWLFLCLSLLMLTELLESIDWSGFWNKI